MGAYFSEICSTKKGRLFERCVYDALKFYFTNAGNIMQLKDICHNIGRSDSAQTISICT